MRSGNPSSVRRGGAVALVVGVAAALTVAHAVPAAAVDTRPAVEPVTVSVPPVPPVPLPVFPLVPATAAPAPVEQPVPEVESSRGNEKVTLCHRSSSADNPYQLITVAASALNGHDGHTGPVFDPATNQSGDTWGDIIPAFDDYPGLNNSGSGAAILANGCAVPAPPVDPGTPIVPITPTVPTKPTPVKPITPTVPTKPKPVKPITPTVPTKPDAR